MVAQRYEEQERLLIEFGKAQGRDRVRIFRRAVPPESELVERTVLATTEMIEADMMEMIVPATESREGELVLQMIEPVTELGGGELVQMMIEPVELLEETVPTEGELLDITASATQLREELVEMAVPAMERREALADTRTVLATEWGERLVEMIVPATELREGDTMFLEKGDWIHADMALQSAGSILIGSAETSWRVTGIEVNSGIFYPGESSIVVHPDLALVAPGSPSLLAGYKVKQGLGKGVVLLTGPFTTIGKLGRTRPHPEWAHGLIMTISSGLRQYMP